MSIPKCNVWVLRAPHPLVSTLPININRLSYVGCAGRSQPQNYFDIQGLFFILLSTVMSQVISKRAWWERAGLIIRNFHSRRWASMIHFKWSIQLESRALAVLNIGDDRLSACVPLCLTSFMVAGHRQQWPGCSWLWGLFQGPSRGMCIWLINCMLAWMCIWVGVCGHGWAWRWLTVALQRLLLQYGRSVGPCWLRSGIAR